MNATMQAAGPGFPPNPARRACAGLLALVTLLGGCSGMRIVDSDVAAFASTGDAAVSLPATYRFERLPSQQARPRERDAFEALLAPELERAGLRREDAAPAYTVQIDALTVRDAAAPWDDPRFIGGGYPLVTRHGLRVLPWGPDMRFESFYFRRELRIIVRRLSDARVVFESHARHEDRWADDDAVLPAMLRAALQGFPAPSPGPRRVQIEIPR